LQISYVDLTRAPEIGNARVSASLGAGLAVLRTISANLYRSRERPFAKSTAGVEAASDVQVARRVWRGVDQMDEKDLLWNLFVHNRDYMKHHEQLRATVANLTVAISAGLIGLITYDKHIGAEDIPLAVMLVAVGIFSSAFTLKHYERGYLHRNRSNGYLNRLNEVMPEAGILEVRSKADRITETQFPRLYSFSVNTFWVILNIFVVVIGIVMTVLSIIGAIHDLR
jgi:hypothetical protein